MAPRKKTEKKSTPVSTPAPEPAPSPPPAPEPAPVPAPEPESEPIPVQNTVVTPVTKKKAKKQVHVVALVTPNGIEGNFQPVEQRRSLIAHLQVHSNQVKFSDTTFEYEPTPMKAPEPYDGDGDDPFSNYTRATFEALQPVNQSQKEDTLGKLVPIADPLGNPQHVSKKDDTTSEDSKPLQPFYRCNLMISYRDTIETKKLPDKVDTACFWCTESFENQPVVIPEREEKGIYKVYGNFCCPECALAYLLEETIDPHVRWERMALLHRMYAELYTDRIFPSSSRQSLKKFGGPMSIEQFRATARARQVRIDIQVPPLVSILGTMDTKPIDFYDTNVRGSNGIATERIMKAEEGLRLRRTKPLKDKESTLDACMKISIKTKLVNESMEST